MFNHFENIEGCSQYNDDFKNARNREYKSQFSQSIESNEQKIIIDGLRRSIPVIESFEQLNLCEVLLKNLRKLNCDVPSPLQKAIFSLITNGFNVRSYGDDGFGNQRILGFSLPIINWILENKPKCEGYGQPICLIICVTESAVRQYSFLINGLISDTDCTSTSFFDVKEIGNVIPKLDSGGGDILIGTIESINILRKIKKPFLNSLKFILLDETVQLIGLKPMIEMEDGLFADISHLGKVFWLTYNEKFIPRQHRNMPTKFVRIKVIERSATNPTEPEEKNMKNREEIKIAKMGAARNRYVIDKRDEATFRSIMGSHFHSLLHENVNIIGPGKDIQQAKSFEEMNLMPALRKNLHNMGIQEPLPIQKSSYPLISSGYNVVGYAHTGSGKTLAYLIPVLQWILQNKKSLRNSEPYCIVLCATRELSEQVYKCIMELTENVELNTVVSFGEIPRRENIQQLREGCDIFVGTVGRLSDYLSHSVLHLPNLKFIVFDEVDKLFDVGTLDHLEKDFFPRSLNIPGLQWLMFSATRNEVIVEDMKSRLTIEYTEIIVGIMNNVNRDVKQNIVEVNACTRLACLIDLLRKDYASHNDRHKTIIFVNTKRKCSTLAYYLSLKGFKAYPAHADLTTYSRRMAVNALETGKCCILVGTDVLSRGLDFVNVAHVINYEIPILDRWTAYVHRLGRTGRLGNEGRATTFYSRQYDYSMSPLLYKWLCLNGQEVPFFIYEDANRTMPSYQASDYNLQREDSSSSSLVEDDDA